MRIRAIFSRLALTGVAFLLSSCGGGRPAPEHDTLIGQATSTHAASSMSLEAQLRASDSGLQLLQLAGTPTCGVNTYAVEYRTVGTAGESTNATAAVMAPTGTHPNCLGSRPLLLYAHATTAARVYNMAQWTDPGQPAAEEGAMVAAFFAAQGYIVVAPNYAGYDRSSLNYHPYLNHTQQSLDMFHALTATRQALDQLGIRVSARLFVTGYSEGGYVAMAVHRELQNRGEVVTASAPLSAPTAVSLLIDYSITGRPTLYGTILMPFVTASWQRQFGNLYARTSDIYEMPYASGIDALLPTLQPDALFSSRQLPFLALFPEHATPGPANPTMAMFYGTDNLVRQSYLTQLARDIADHPCPGNGFGMAPGTFSHQAPLRCSPQTGLRQAAVANDLRNWVPTAPMLMCGAAEDPVVNFASTLATIDYFHANGVASHALTLVDLETTETSDAYTALRRGFSQAKSLLWQRTGGDEGDKTRAVTFAYHDTLVYPFCLAAARQFFAAQR